MLANAPHARWVHSIATGLERIMSPTLTAHPSVLTNTRDVFGPALAEFAMLDMLFFAKNVPRLARAHAAKSWDPFQVETLAGKVLGLVGFGSIRCYIRSTRRSAIERDEGRDRARRRKKTRAAGSFRDG